MRVPKAYVPLFRDLTPEETDVVRAYATRMGRCWKSELRIAWYYASEPGILQALRNELGPEWLNGYRLPKVSK